MPDALFEHSLNTKDDDAGNVNESSAPLSKAYSTRAGSGIVGVDILELKREERENSDHRKPGSNNGRGRSSEIYRSCCKYWCCAK